MLQRVMGRLGFRTSVVMYGGAALSNVTAEEADASIAYALQHGINHFDTAASYGDGRSEQHLGRWLSQPEVRRAVFIATKTGQRERDAAKRQIHQSIERLRADRVDLLQLHAIGTLEELDRVTGPGGALEAAIQVARLRDGSVERLSPV